MAQLGSDKNPIVMNRKGKSTRILGLMGRAYKDSLKSNYSENYDRIFKKKETVGEKDA